MHTIHHCRLWDSWPAALSLEVLLHTLPPPGDRQRHRDCASLRLCNARLSEALGGTFSYCEVLWNISSSFYTKLSLWGAQKDTCKHACQPNIQASNGSLTHHHYSHWQWHSPSTCAHPNTQSLHGSISVYLWRWDDCRNNSKNLFFPPEIVMEQILCDCSWIINPAEFFSAIVKIERVLCVCVESSVFHCIQAERSSVLEDSSLSLRMRRDPMSFSVCRQSVLSSEKSKFFQCF